jgi:hypothetical protein
MASVSASEKVIPEKESIFKFDLSSKFVLKFATKHLSNKKSE